MVKRTGSSCCTAKGSAASWEHQDAGSIPDRVGPGSGVAAAAAWGYSCGLDQIPGLGTPQGGQKENKKSWESGVWLPGFKSRLCYVLAV